MNKPIILASASPQRKNLMNLLGIPYSIRPSKADELKKMTSTCAQFVKDNAILKAREVAGQLKDGIVIGADTIVYTGGKKVIGKPKDLKHAKDQLKLLMSRPHWVYTGVAVIDVKAKKEIIDYEKTKIFMTRLTDDAIDEYYRHMSPLDKAGGFDIEGKGSVFIRRIEGCYFNVVGLPLAKLRLMLKKVGVHILMLMAVISLTGCATEYNLATQREETLLYGSEKEKSMGAAMAQGLEKQVTLNNDIDVNERVERLLKSIVDVCDRQELVYTIKVIDEDKLNAVSLPGGYIYIYKGIIDKVDNDDQLASVIAHEVGHITAKHSMKRLQSIYGDTFLRILAMQTTNGRFTRGTDIALTSIFLEHAREDEYQADALGIKYMQKAGYKPSETGEMLKKLRAQQMKEPSRSYSYWRTHPYLTQRIAAADQVSSSRLGFKEYLNLTGEK